MNKELKALQTKCKEYKVTKFKEKGHSIRNALHIPYNGMGNPDYITFYDFLQEDIRDLILEIIENGNQETGEEVTTIEELKQALEDYDYNGSLHQYVESSLTWHMHVDEALIIIRGCEFEEDDSGLWEGQQPEEAISSKAFWTYKAELETKAKEFIEEWE